MSHQRYSLKVYGGLHHKGLLEGAFYAEVLASDFEWVAEAQIPGFDSLGEAA